MKNIRRSMATPSQQRLFDSWANKIDSLDLTQISEMQEKLSSDPVYNDPGHVDHQAMLFVMPYLVGAQMILRGDDPDGSDDIQNQQSNLEQLRKNLTEGTAQPAEGLSVDEHLALVTREENNLKIKADEENKIVAEQTEKNEAQNKIWADEKSEQVEQQRQRFMGSSLYGYQQGTPEYDARLKVTEERWEKYQLS